MARQYEMSWEGAPNYRWAKMYKGARYRVSCDDLGVGRSKKESYQKANEWWRAKQAEIEQKRVQPEHADAERVIQQRVAYARANNPGLLPVLEEAALRLHELAPDDAVLLDKPSIESNLKIAKLFGIEVPEDLDEKALQYFFGDTRVWQDRLACFTPTSSEKTAENNIAKFLDEAKTQQKPATHRELSRHFKKLLDQSTVLHRQADITKVNEETVSEYYHWLTDQNLSTATHNKYLGFFKRFIEWLYQQYKIEALPRNLKSRAYRKKRSHAEVKTYDNVREVVYSLPDEKRLWALLGLNCGMTNVDLGALQWENIHQDIDSEGNCHLILTRRRQKTGSNPKVPTVRYRLWSETKEVLGWSKEKTGHVFTTETGQPLYSSTYGEDGKPKINDGFARRWKRLKTKPSIPLSKFRNIAATALKTDVKYRSFVDYFLAHVPKTVADQHYSAEADEPFFDALDYVREHLLSPDSSS